MKKIISYTIVFESTYRELSASVNEKIRDGWQPLGGVAVVQHNPSEFWHSQAMVKYEPDNDNRVGSGLEWEEER